MNIGQLIASLGVDTTGVRLAAAELKRFEQTAGRSISNINQRFAATGKSMQTFGRNMSLYVTAPIVAAGVASFKMQKDFEASMTKVTSLVGIAKEQTNAWGEDIIKLAPQIGKAPTELADALFFVTSAGIRGANAMEVLTASAQASAVGLGETKVVADLVTSAMNAYGAENLNAAQATDILLAAVREGKAEAPALAASLGQVLPIASAMGVTFDQVGAAVAAMTRTGTDAATASIQLRQILNSMIKPSQQAEQALSMMGTSGKQLRKTIKEDGLLKALMDINSLTKQYGEETVAKVFPNIRALSGVLDLMGTNVADNIKIFESLENATGSLDKAFEETAKTIQFQYDQALTQAKTSLTVLGKDIAQAALPLMKALADRIKSVSDWFSTLSVQQREVAIRIAAVAAAIGPAAIILGVLVSGIGKVITVGYQAIRMFKLLKLAMLSNPITAVGLALASLAAYLLLVRNRTDKATVAQASYNDELKKTNQLLANTSTLDKKISVLGSLDQAQVNELRQQIEDRLKQERDLTVDIKAETLKRLNNDKQLSELKKGLAQAETQFAKIALQSQIYERRKAIAANLNNEFVASRDRIKIFEDYLQQVKKRQEQFEKENTPEEVTGGGKVGIIPALEKQIADLNAKKIQPGTNLNEIIQYGFQIDVLQTKLEKLQNPVAALMKVDDAMIILQRRSEEFIKELDAEMASLDNLTISFDIELPDVENLTAMEMAVDRLSQSLKNLGRETVVLQNFGSVAAQLANQVGVAFVDTQNALSASVDIVLNAANQVISTLLQEAVVALIAGETVKYGLAGLVTAAVGIGLLTALVSKSRQKVAGGGGAKGPAKMADGGTVPPGYSNDTYPAMLSSGETVLPSPIPLGGITGMANRKIRIEFGEPVITNQDIRFANIRAEEIWGNIE